jgi:uncharacterized membrane protein YjfL (UPF0719 family)
MDNLLSLKALVAAVVFSAIGLLAFALAFWVFDRKTPGNFWKEILDEHNTALAIMAGSVAIGISMIISAAIHG